MNFLKLGRLQNAFLDFAKAPTQMLGVRPISVSSPLQQQAQGEEKGGKKKWVIGAVLVGAAGALWYFTRGKKPANKPGCGCPKK